MTAAIDNTEQTTDALAGMRLLSAAPDAPEAEQLIATERQATYLGNLLAGSDTSIPDRLIELMPSLDITYANDFAGHGFSFWDGDSGSWCLYLQSRDTGARQILTMLREIKYIVDEPMRSKPTGTARSTWKKSANQFAHRVAEIFIEESHAQNCRLGCAHE